MSDPATRDGPRPHRRAYIDWARGIAVLVMIQAHTFDSWTRLADRTSAFYRWSMVFGGFAAPLFLFLAGVGVVLSASAVLRRGGAPRDAVGTVVTRGLEIFVLAFLFRLQGFVITPGAPLLNLFRVDILNVMGPTMVLAGLVWSAARSSRGRAAAFAALTAAIALLTPIVRVLAGIDHLPIFFQWYLRPSGEHTTFMLFPWMGFVMAGAAAGVLVDGTRSAAEEARLQVALGLAGAGLVALGFLTAAQPAMYPQTYFWTTSPTFFSIRTGTMLLVFASCYWVARATTVTAGTDPLAVLGRGSLFVYWIHVELVYGYATWPLRRRLPPALVVVAYLAFSGLMYLALVGKNRFVERRRRAGIEGHYSAPRTMTPGVESDRRILMNRRDFARLLTIGGAAPFLTPDLAWARADKLPPTPANPDEKFWASVRDQFVMPKDLTMLNAANLCPSSGPVLETMYRLTKDMDQDPSSDNRVKLGDGRENTRKLLAQFLRVTPEEIVITRNTSESNNLVSTGIDLKAGDEVLLTADNHPSNHTAWQEKAKRFGFTVIDVPTPNPHPGFDHYVQAFTKAITPKTKVISFTHQTSTVGDLFPAKEICRLARERGILTLVDGAQSFGLMDVDLSDIQPDFYSGSAHKWACGPKENGVLYINKSAQTKIWASIFSAYPGRVGVSRTFEGFGQRDEPAMMAFGEALTFQTGIGRAQIEKRSRELTQALLQGLRKIDGVKIWTSPDPSRTVAVVSFQPGGLDARKLSTALYQKDRIGCATRGGQDRPGIRFSPHFYNTHADIDRTVAAIKKYMATGV